MIGGVPDTQKDLLVAINAAISSVEDATVYDLLSVVSAVLVSNARLYLDKEGDKFVDTMLTEMRRKIDDGVATFDGDARDEIRKAFTEFLSTLDEPKAGKN